jgi:hypothetical protein
VLSDITLAATIAAYEEFLAARPIGGGEQGDMNRNTSKNWSF